MGVIGEIFHPFGVLTSRHKICFRHASPSGLIAPELEFEEILAMMIGTSIPKGLQDYILNDD